MSLAMCAECGADLTGVRAARTSGSVARHAPVRTHCDWCERLCVTDCLWMRVPGMSGSLEMSFGAGVGFTHSKLVHGDHFLKANDSSSRDVTQIPSLVSQEPVNLWTYEEPLRNTTIHLGLDEGRESDCQRSWRHGSRNSARLVHRSSSSLHRFGSRSLDRGTDGFQFRRI